MRRSVPDTKQASHLSYGVAPVTAGVFQVNGSRRVGDEVCFKQTRTAVSSQCEPHSRPPLQHNIGGTLVCRADESRKLAIWGPALPIGFRDWRGVGDKVLDCGWGAGDDARRRGSSRCLAGGCGKSARSSPEAHPRPSTVTALGIAGNLSVVQ